MSGGKPRALVAGWFSYAGGHATGGDLMARDLLCDWLDSAGFEHVTAFASPFTGGPSLDNLDPAQFTHAFFVCGPFGRWPYEQDFLTRFSGCRLIGLNLSLEADPDEWQPFDLVIERDSKRAVNPDMVFASRAELPPLVGICLREAHPAADVATANRAIERLLERHEAARVQIDTRLDVNATRLRSAGEIEALISHADLIVTTRLHGLVLGLKNAVPVVAVDAVRSGGKISAQCARIGWPNLVRLDELDDERLDRAFAFALGDEARELARRSSDRAAADVEEIRRRLTAELSGTGPLEERFAARQTDEGRREFLASVAVPKPPPFAARLRRLLKRVFPSGRSAGVRQPR